MPWSWTVREHHPMKPIEAEKQVSLGPARAFQLAMSGIMYRFFRSGITVAILCLAVAFLVHTLVYGLLAHSSEYSAFQEVARQRELGGQISRLTSPDSATRIIEEFARETTGRMSEYREWGDLSQGDFQTATATARRVMDVRAHFEDLPDDSRAILVGDADVLTLLRRFRDERQYELFAERVEQLAVSYPLEGREEFQRLVDAEWPVLVEIVERVRSGQAEAIASVSENYPDLSARDLLVAQPDGFVAALRDAGFATDEMDFESLAEFAARDAARERLESTLLESDVQLALIRHLDIAPEDLTLPLVFGWLRSRAGDAESLSDLMSRTGVELPPETLTGLAEFYTRSERLQEVVGTSPPASEAGLFSLEGRLRWLILLAFFVCIVGVANAMLMSVTERFNEIATMKCLGAMDGFVMMMFVFEAAIQGLIGGVIGVFLGTLLALLRGLAEYGALVAFSSELLTQMFLAAILALAAGMVLATAAAVGPSLVAARLAPMEAMRVE